MPNSIQVRTARAEDKDAVVAFCQNTFSWGDYIADVYDQWLVDDEGKLLVATIDQEPVGLTHVAFLGNAAGWMEGMRVHPDFRRQGVSTELDRVGRQVAREHGCRMARLVTSMKNIPAQKSLAPEGYQRTAQFNEWETEPLSENFPSVRIANETDISKILSIWNESKIRKASGTVVPNSHWRWKEIDEARLRQKILAHEIRVIENGFAFVDAREDGDWNALTIYALAGSDPALFDLARGVRAEAGYRGYAHVEATLVDYAPLNAVLERAGYRTDGGLYLYEQEL